MRKLFLFIPIVLLSSICLADEIVQGHYCYTYGDNESLKVARDIAKSLAIRDAMESYKVFVQSDSAVKNFQLTDDFINIISSGYLKNMKVIKHTEEGRTVCDTIQAGVEPNKLEELIKGKLKKVEEQKDPEMEKRAGTSIGCGVGGGELYQSFLADNTQLKSMSLLLRAGGKFPETGFTAHLRLRDSQIDGAILWESDRFVAGPQGTGKLITVSFPLDGTPKLKIRRPYIIQWTTPKEGDSVLTWMISSSNSYSDGNAFGCGGTPIMGNDFVFEVSYQ